VISPTVDRVETPDELARLEPEWRRLFAAHGAGVPFRTIDWYRAWWNAFPSSNLRVSDRSNLLAFRAPSGELVGIAPLMLTRRPGRGFLAVRVLDYIGTDPNVTEIRGPLVDPDWEEGLHVALREHLGKVSGEWDLFRWRGVLGGSAGEHCVRTFPDVTIGQSIPAYTLSLSGTWEEFKSTRSRNLKESLRKCTNSLKRDGHVATFSVLTNPETVPEGLRRFLELHRARSELRDTVSHPNVFASPAAQRFLFDLFARLAARGEARVFQLEIGGDVIAIRLGFALGETLYLYYSGYDPAWARYSVMTTTLAEALRHALSEGSRVVHLSTGTDVSKTRWGAQPGLLHDAVQLSPSLRGRLTGRILAGLQGEGQAGRLLRLASRPFRRAPGSLVPGPESNPVDST
jgi:CelD/BcsL family acetyltransferase involved in cellulose biosynthesis